MSPDDLRNLSAPELVSLCVGNTANTDPWSEFLRRFAPRIRFFVRKTLRRLQNGSVLPSDALISGINGENDLFQDTILRLVDRDCALLKRFRGSEEKFVTYLAVIAESVVRDSFRKALRRPNGQKGCSERVLDSAKKEGANGGGKVAPVAEQHVLAREVWNISLRTIKNLSGSLYARDRQTFELYFSQGLSVRSIAQLKTIGLSKTAVEKVLSRVRNRVRAAIAAKGRPEERSDEKDGQRL